MINVELLGSSRLKAIGYRDDPSLFAGQSESISYPWPTRCRQRCYLTGHLGLGADWFFFDVPLWRWTTCRLHHLGFPRARTLMALDVLGKELVPLERKFLG